jgi:hypothetical protein
MMIKGFFQIAGQAHWYEKGLFQPVWLERVNPVLYMPASSFSNLYMQRGPIFYSLIYQTPLLRSLILHNNVFIYRFPNFSGIW